MPLQELYEDLGLVDRKEPKRLRRLRQWRQQRRDRSLAKMATRITGLSPIVTDSETTDDELEYLTMSLLANSEPRDEVVL
jgi:hypothetical protein